MVTIADKLKQKQAEASTARRLPHVMIVARAGTGKTTTLIEEIKQLKGIRSDLAPSGQQLLIWDAIDKSLNSHILRPSLDDPKKFERVPYFKGSICFVAFGKMIAKELQKRVPIGVDAMTCHSLGYRAVRAAFPQIKEPQENRVQRNLAYYLKMEPSEIKIQRPGLLPAVESVVKFCKMKLLGTFSELSLEELQQLIKDHGIAYEGSVEFLLFCVRAIMTLSLDVNRDNAIDYNDQIWLPIALTLPLKQYDLLLVDEAQDLNACQQELTIRSGRRLVYCGDPRQAIQGFTGSDCNSMETLFNRLNQEPSECYKFMLTRTYRCGKKIVKYVNRLVDDLEAADSNPEGEVLRVENAASYRIDVKPGDMVICRTNAPIVRECLRMLARRKKAKVQGREVGASLLRLVEDLNAVGLEQFWVRLERWYDRNRTRENAKKYPSEAYLQYLEDHYECLKAFSDCDSMAELVKAIQDLFSDVVDEDCILYSSMHRSKGLEANNVYLLLLNEAPVPYFMAKTPESIDQEWNLLYVAETRAKLKLVRVTGTLR